MKNNFDFNDLICEISNDIENTMKIIPFIRTGVYVVVDKSYSGMWLHSTMKNCKPIKIK